MTSPLADAIRAHIENDLSKAAFALSAVLDECEQMRGEAELALGNPLWRGTFTAAAAIEQTIARALGIKES
ncbi:hypothetical protein GCM10010172_07320 [Paractinoplanes ferrugineus]|uniref:Uncharacterized protein n=1 Tax=Paractinoplanes ferrugineus TaxID=113564 RepID=A0A919MJ72_9ACTN|nr:hypothetical protein [Actinoplanes ferrugineus]GIE16789.1 hypothetical protein Afe05nite_86290 [Actinoplanes ferrugineus]